MALVTLTQGHLKLLDLCPRRFQYAYLDQLAAPTDPAMLERQQWGTCFHRVVQQRELGLPTDPLLAQNPELDAAVQALVTTAPELFDGSDRADATAVEIFRQSEHRRSLAWGGYELTVIYDLLRLTSSQGQIVDWKTYRQRPKPAQLAQDWQTRLYLYILAETSAFAPEQLVMSYWFIPPPPAPGAKSASARPSQICLPYSAAKHRRTARDLRRLITQLDELLQTHQDFPKVDVAKGHCQSCPFAIRCQRMTDGIVIPAIGEIAEIPL